MDKLRVLHVTNNFPSEKNPIFGIFVKEQIESLEALNVKNEVFFINSRYKGKIEYLKSFFRLSFKLMTSKYDIIHCHHSFSGIIFLLTLRFIDNNCVLTYQNPPSKEGGILIFKILLFFFDKIIFKNQVNSFKSKKINVIPNGVNLNFFRQINYIKSINKLNLDINKKYILFMDSYKKRKQKRIDKFQSVISSLKKIDKSVEPLFLFNTKRSDIPYYINASSLHIITSDFEGSPNSVKECLACNVPIVSTPVGDVNNLIKDVKNCYLSSNFEVSNIVKLSIISLSSNQKSNGRNRIKKLNLTMENISMKIINLYKDILQ